MKAVFNIRKDERKALVAAVSESTGVKAIYSGAPLFNYSVGVFIIDRDGVLICEAADAGDSFSELLSQLIERGFVTISSEGSDENINSCDDDILHEATDAEELCGDMNEAVNQAASDTFTITVPSHTLTTTALLNLRKLVTAKARLICKMIGADALPIVEDTEQISFPWFRTHSSKEEIAAYSQLVERLVATARQKQRVVSVERELAERDNEKYKARCFLLSLGFIGREFAEARKILLAPMKGSSAFRVGNSKKAQEPETKNASVCTDNTGHGANTLPNSVEANTEATVAQQSAVYL